MAAGSALKGGAGRGGGRKHGRLRTGKQHTQDGLSLEVVQSHSDSQERTYTYVVSLALFFLGKVSFVEKLS